MESKPRKKILVTGASGFLGWHTVNKLQHEHDILGIFCNKSVQFEHAQTRQLDLTHVKSVEKFLAEDSVDAVVHCAALPNAKICENAQQLALSVNVNATENLLRFLPNPKTLFIYISTDLVFNGKQAPYTEEDKPSPLSYYGKSKRMAEESVLANWKNPIILRPCLMYGPKTETGRGSFLQWMDEAFQQGNAVSLFRDEIRTPVFVLDVINAIAHLLTELTPFRLYHVGGPERIRRSEFGRRVAAIRGYTPELIKETQLAELSTGYPRPEDVSLDSSLIQNTFNLRLTPIGEGIRKSFGLPLEET